MLFDVLCYIEHSYSSSYTVGLYWSIRCLRDLFETADSRDAIIDFIKHVCVIAYYSILLYVFLTDRHNITE